MKYETRLYGLIVKPEGEPIFSEQATIISIDDEAAGVFFTLEQNGGMSGSKKVLITSEEWPVISAAVDRMIEEWRDDAN